MVCELQVVRGPRFKTHGLEQRKVCRRVVCPNFEHSWNTQLYVYSQRTIILKVIFGYLGFERMIGNLQRFVLELS